MGRNVRDHLAPMSWDCQVCAIPNEGHHNGAHFVLYGTSLQLIQAYSSQRSFSSNSWLTPLSPPISHTAPSLVLLVQLRVAGSIPAGRTTGFLLHCSDYFLLPVLRSLPSIRSIWLVWSLSIIWLNRTMRIDQRNQMNEVH